MAFSRSRNFGLQIAPVRQQKARPVAQWLDGHSDAMLEHQVGKLAPIEQNDALRQVLHEFVGMWAECRGGHENTLRRS